MLGNSRKKGVRMSQSMNAKQGFAHLGAGQCILIEPDLKLDVALYFLEGML
jgi:hypothetical protein